jgi:hypothetical protein
MREHQYGDLDGLDGGLKWSSVRRLNDAKVPADEDAESLGTSGTRIPA